MLRCSGRDEKQCLGPSARQTYALSPVMHMFIPFPLTALEIPIVAPIANFLLRSEALYCRNANPSLMHFLKPSDACLDARSATFIRAEAEVFVRSGCTYLEATVPP
jgi:hypothetical protein